MKRARKESFNPSSQIPSSIIYTFDGLAEDDQGHQAHSACVMPAPRALESQFGVMHGNGISTWMQEAMDSYLEKINELHDQQSWETKNVIDGRWAIEADGGIAQQGLYTPIPLLDNMD